jgi:flagellar hook-associated protein FlgK
LVDGLGFLQTEIKYVLEFAVTDAVRQAVEGKRSVLNDTATMMRDQRQEVSDQLAARTTELNGVEAQIADLDAWLIADSAANPTVAQPV